jgi:hypothetical protein
MSSIKYTANWKALLLFQYIYLFKLLYLEAHYCIAEHSADEFQENVSRYKISTAAIVLSVDVK